MNMLLASRKHKLQLMYSFHNQILRFTRAKATDNETDKFLFKQQ